MLSAKSLTFEYGPQGPTFTYPDIHLEQGQDLLILGQSGVGKTTLLHLLAGLLTPKSGQVQLNNTTLGSLNTRQLDRFRGQHIGLVFQRPHFVEALNLQQNMLLVQHLAGHPKSPQRITQLLEQLSMAQHLRKKPYALSQGEQQRAAIAMALVNKPSLILADEPTSSLDDANCERVAQLLKTQAQANQANLVVITHDARLKPLFENALTL